MCGIVGYIATKPSELYHTRDQFMETALIWDSIRGMDSTGVMRMGKDNKIGWFRAAVDGSRFIRSDEYQSYPLVKDAWAVVGHNRAATRGEIHKDNAHPFVHGNVSLVHNGTLLREEQLPHQKKDITVDSDLITYNLSKAKPEEALDILQRLYGSYALVWFDTRDKSVNMARNGQRPLHFGADKYSESVYFMSEGEMLNGITARFPAERSQLHSIYQLAPLTWLKWKFGEMVPKCTKILPKTIVIANTYSNYGYHQNDRGYGAVAGYHNKDPKAQSGGKKQKRHSGRISKPQVKIGNELLPIPSAHREMVTDWYAMSTSENYQFRPTSWEPWGTQTVGMTTGEVWHHGWNSWQPALVMGQHQSIFTRYMCEKYWTVRIVGVNSTGMTEINGLTFLVKVKKHKWDHYDQSRPLASKYDERITILDSEELLNDGQAIGPDGNSISLEEFLYLTRSGCVYCTGNIDAEDHESVEWVGESTNQPLCPECVEIFTDPQYDGMDPESARDLMHNETVH